MSRLILPPGYEPRVARRPQLAPIPHEEKAGPGRIPDQGAARLEADAFICAHAEATGLSWEEAANDLLRRAPLERREKLRGAIDTMKREHTSSGRTLIRVRIARGEGEAIEWGEVKIRPMIDLDNVVLCQQFGFDSDCYVFDLPSSAGGTGSTSSGTRGNREVNGFVFRKGPGGKPDRNERPIATVEFLREGRQATERDVDPTDRADFERLG